MIIKPIYWRGYNPTYSIKCVELQISIVFIRGTLNVSMLNKFYKEIFVYYIISCFFEVCEYFLGYINGLQIFIMTIEGSPLICIILQNEWYHFTIYL
jgi:hypothetical protein